MDSIASASTSLQSVADVTQREISLLREYRTRLLADVIIGELDAGEAAARLPDEMGDEDEAETSEEGEEMTEDLETAAVRFDDDP